MWEDLRSVKHKPCLTCLLLLWALAGWAPTAYGQIPPIPPSDIPIHYLTSDSVHQVPYTSIGILEDLSGTFSLKDIEQKLSTFIPYTDLPGPPNSGSALWGFFHLHNRVSHARKWVLHLDHPDFSDVFIYRQSGSHEHQQVGRLQKRALKAIYQGDQEYVPFDLMPGERIMVLIKNREWGPTTPFIHAEISSYPHWKLHAYQFMFHQTLGNITFVSILVIMVLYHLMVYFSTWRKPYLHYSFYTLSLAAYVYFEAISVHYGLGNPILNQYLALSSLLLISIFFYQFARSFLQTPTLIPKWDAWLERIIFAKLLLIAGLLIYMYLTFDKESAYRIAKSMLFLDIPIVAVFFFELYKTKAPLAKYFIAASSFVFVIGISLFLWYNFKDQVSLLPFFLIFVVHILVFSLGLGYQLRLDQQEKVREKEEKLRSQKSLNQKLAGVNAAIGRFVPKEFISSLGGKSVEDITLGEGVEKENATVLFCDIRAYTTIAENMTLQENFDFLNGYLGRVGPIVTQYGGFVNQYFGDGVMAIFLDSPDAAVQAAMEIQDTIRQFNEVRIAQQHLPIRVGVGIHTGPLMMGIIGDERRIEAGVVSDTVNTCSRMEGLTKHYGVYTLVSECTILAMKDAAQFEYRFLGRVLVKGRKEPIGVYDFYQGDPIEIMNLKKKSQSRFESGLKNYYYRNFALAAHDFHEVLETFPTDLAATRYLNYCEEFILEGIEEDWCGVEQVGKY
ncbi:MAG: adenylate/guanylate cyclase domain-containing protein [Bacteroidota bacterium]